MSPQQSGEHDELAATLLAALGSDPVRPAIGSYRASSQLVWRTRGQLLERALAIAGGLRAAGFKRREACVIAPVDEGELDAAAVIVGCIIAGCVPLVVPAVDGGFGGVPELLDRSLSTTRSRAVLVASSDSAKVEAVAKLSHSANRRIDTIGIDDLVNGAYRADAAGAHALDEDCRMMQLTSGTTDVNRVCMWSAPALLTCLRGVATCMRLRPGDVFFTWSGLHHTVGMLNKLMLGLTYQIPVVFMSARKFATAPSLWLRGVHECGATITTASNFAFKFVADAVAPQELEGLDLSRVRAFWNTGERVVATSYASFYERLRATGLLRAALRANYGSAENTGGATFSDVEAEELTYETVDRDHLQASGLAMLVGADRVDPGHHLTIASLGAPWPGLEVIIRDDAGRPLPDGAIGEIALATPSRFLGYCNNPGATAAAVEGNLLITGDLGYLRNGQLFWVGRKQECIVIRGRKIDPSAFLPILEPVRALRPGAYVAFGVDDDQSGTQRAVVAVEVERAGNDAKPIVREIRRAVLADLGISVEVIALAPDTLKTTISGKRRHRFYKDLYLRGEFDALRLNRA